MLEQFQSKYKRNNLDGMERCWKTTSPCLVLTETEEAKPRANFLSMLLADWFYQKRDGHVCNISDKL